MADMNLATGIFLCVHVREPAIKSFTIDRNGKWELKQLSAFELILIKHCNDFFVFCNLFYSSKCQNNITYLLHLDKLVVFSGLGHVTEQTGP